MEHLSSDMEQQEENQHQEQLQWRRDKVQELCSKGYSQREMSDIVGWYWDSQPVDTLLGLPLRWLSIHDLRVSSQSMSSRSIT
jgi:hypothetical protein